MLRWGLVAAVVASGCVESRGVPCGDSGLVCAEGTVCRELTPAAGQPVEDRCVRPAQLDACAAHAIGDACDAVTDGRCYPRLLTDDGAAASDELLCLAVGCGNGRVDADHDEQCDDTNAVNGDGCSASCLSNETCGNGIVDAYAHTLPGGAIVAPEQCDDHNDLPHDGCSALCTTESPRWTHVHVGVPAARYGHTLVATEGGRAVMFGGDDDHHQLLGDTWEWDGQGWHEALPTFHPSPRAGHASAYDPVRHRVVVFGGEIGDSTLWEWDGTRWSATTPPDAPPAIVDGAMAFDRGRGKLVLWGTNPKLMESSTSTWEWDGTSWTSFAPATLGPFAAGPSTQSGHAMAYDPARGALVLVGYETSPSDVDELRVWEYAGSGMWMEQPATGPRPAARIHATLVYDPARGALVLAGGQAVHGDPTVAYDDAWAWDGTAWTSSCTSCGGARSAGAAAYVPGQGIVMFGGLGAEGPVDTFHPTHTTLAWTGAAWAQVPVFEPGATTAIGHVAALDPPRARLITCCDGQNASALSTHAWSELAPPPFASRTSASLVYDPVDDVHVLFGGRDGAESAETYTFDGDEWTLVAAPGPSARAQHAAAWLGDRMVMFGGEQSLVLPLDDMWTWNQTWTSVPKTTPWPAGRYGAAIAVDPVRQRIVMFGGASGMGGLQLLDDTWEWDGTAWKEIELTTRPPQRTSAAMAWDPATQQLLLFGGSSGGGSVRYDDTWAYDGTAWRLLETFGGPAGRDQHTLVASPDGRGVLMYGGNSPPEVWRLRWENHAKEETCSGYDDGDGDGATGCADDECWAVCAPLCPPPPPNTSTTDTCTAAPRCGDDTCSELESCRSCPEDCHACTPVCGDLVCDPGEACPGDCP